MTLEIQHDHEFSPVRLLPGDNISLNYSLTIKFPWGENKAAVVQAIIDAAAATAFEFVDAVTYAEADPPLVGAPE